jgi:protein involved in polysaccharide export with SLBB domain
LADLESVYVAVFCEAELRFLPRLFSMVSKYILALCALSVCLAEVGDAQVPTQQQIQQAVQNPALADQIRQKIQSSGLSPDQIRSRLQSAGYSSTLLDSYLAPKNATSATELTAVSQQTMDALAALFPEQPVAAGTIKLPVDTGLRVNTALDTTPKPGLELFGAKVFRGSRTQFQPLLNGPVPTNYKVGPGDALAVVITGDVEFAYSLEVTRDGFIVIPQVGQVFVNNLTMDEVRAVLRRRIGAVYSGVSSGSTKLNVTLASLRTNQIFVVGEVVQPGAYQLSSVATVLNALYAAGGPTDRGNFRSVSIRRQGQVVAMFDLYDYLLRGDTQNDVMLQQGDVVFVPVHGPRVSIQGAVLRPAIYELKPGQTLRDLVADAGGFLPSAALERLSIDRVVPAGQRAVGSPDRIVVDVPIGQVKDGVAPPFPLEPADEVTVFEVSQAQSAFLELRGSVYQPGRYGWHPQLRLSELIKLAGGFQPAIYAGAAHVERLNLKDSTRSLLRVPLPADSTQPFPDDLVLSPYDVVTVYGRENLREDHFVTIGGMVNQPGRFPYRNGMTLRDLVLMAHGLQDGAYLDAAEVSRLPADRTGGQLAITMRPQLDSTYLFEPGTTTYRRLPGIPGKSSGAPDVFLEPEDQILILRQPEFEKHRTVIVGGEVRFPGPYALTRKDERLSDLIQRAGGLLPTAYEQGTRFMRSFGGAGRINIDLSSALAKPGSANDVIMQPGDSLIVLEYSPSVKVEGAVNSPTSVLYKEGADLDYYIQNAGGFANNAEKDKVSVRFADGTAQVKSRNLLFFTSSPTPGPGSTVTVPVQAATEPFNTTAFLSSVAQILASSVAIVVLATRK